MDFLKERHDRTIYHYKTDESIVSGTPQELAEYFGKDLLFEPGEVVQHYTEDYQYAGFDPLSMSLTTKVAYEQNGRKAIRVTSPGGHIQHRSLTKDRMLESGKQDKETKSVLTKACSETYAKAKTNMAGRALQYFNKYVKRS